MMKWALAALAIGVMSMPADAGSFGGYECTDDCSGHAAGYRWAEQRGIGNASDCNGNSSSFAEGCQAYTEDSSRGADEDDDGNSVD